jgi:hypothetical protein
MKTRVYAWCLSAQLNADLEREARARKVPVATILDAAVREWLKRNGADMTGGEAQRRLHAAAAHCLGVLTTGNARRAETAREAIRERLRRRRAR